MTFKSDRAEYWSRCPTCERRDQEERERRERESKEYEKQARIRMLLAGANIPERFADANFEMFKADTKGRADALTAAQQLYDGEVMNAVFSGNVGTGKTLLSCALVREEIFGSQNSARYVTQRQFVRAMRSTWDKESDLNETQMLKKFSGVTLLVVDEVGTGSGSDPEREMLLELIDLRYSGDVQTVLVTNLDRLRLADYIGERAMDRLRDRGLWVPFNWKSARGSV